MSDVIKNIPKKVASHGFWPETAVEDMINILATLHSYGFDQETITLNLPENIDECLNRVPPEYKKHLPTTFFERLSGSKRIIPTYRDQVRSLIGRIRIKAKHH